jgi:hypothetical protein
MESRVWSRPNTELLNNNKLLSADNQLIRKVGKRRKSEAGVI